MPFNSPSRAAVALLLFLGAASSSRALQLGETQAQIVARHGAPAVEDHGRQLAMYYWAGWSSRLEFRGGVVEKLIYKKNDYLSATDIASLLQANGGAKRWRENTPVGADTRQWSRDDGAAASCDAAHAAGMVFQSGKAVISTLQQLGADSKAATTPGALPAPAAPGVLLAPATPPAAAAFFPDSLAVQARPDPKLSEITVPAATPNPGKAPRLKVADSKPAAPITSEATSSIRPPAPLPARIELPATIDPPVKGEPMAAGKPTTAEEPPAHRERSQPAPAPPAGEADRGPGRIVAFGCLVFGITGALLLLYKSLPLPRRRDSSSIGEYPAPRKDAGLDGLRWDQVELLVGEIHRRVGYTAELSAGLGSENGIDLTLRRNNETVLVQCKHWKTFRVTEREMREFYGAMASSGSPYGIFVTMGGVSRGAREFAEGKGIDLIDRQTLEERISGIAHPGENLCRLSEWIEEFAANSRIFDPECPLCREPMSLRRHPAGHSAFWGCRDYPRCAGKREPRRDLLDLVSAPRASFTVAAV